MASAAQKSIKSISYAKYGYMFIAPFFIVSLGLKSAISESIFFVHSDFIPNRPQFFKRLKPLSG